MAAKFTLGTFDRLIRYSAKALSEISTNVEEVSLQDNNAQSVLLSLKSSLTSEYRDIKLNLDNYMMLDPLPAGLSEERLEEGCSTLKSLHFSIFRKIEMQLASLSLSTPSVAQTVPPTHSEAASNSHSAVSVPKFQIEPFSGKFEDWPAFFARYESLIHENASLTKVKKFQYLLSLLDPTPRKCIDHFTITDANYDAAIQSLLDRYHNPRRLVVFHCDKLLSLPNLDSRSPTNMRTFLDVYTSNFRALSNMENLNVTEAVFTTFLLGKLDVPTRARFESANSNPLEFPQLQEIINFLQTQVVQKENALLTSEIPQVNTHVQNRGSAPKRLASLVTNSLPSSASVKCHICQSLKHRVYKCPQLLSKPVTERLSLIKQHGLCTNCLGTHYSSKCPSKYVCHMCRLKHHSLLHIPDGHKPTSNSDAEPQVTQQPVPATPISASVLSCATTLQEESSVLMSTCLVRLQTSSENYIIVRAVLDSASHASFITEKCAQLLNVRRTHTPVTISGVGHTLTRSSGRCHLSLATIPGQIVSSNESFIILPRIAANTPMVKISNLVRNATRHYQLADPTFDVPATIDALLSADITVSVLQGAPLSLGTSLPFVIPTVFGHVIMGKAPIEQFPCNIACCDGSASSFEHSGLESTAIVSAFVTSLHDDLLTSVKRFWEIEEPPPLKNKLSGDDQYCEELYVNSTTRTEDGRYVVRLPFKEASLPLGESYAPAVKRLYSLERKFKLDPVFHQQYISFMRDYESQGHMCLAPSGATNKYFIPHHGIFKAHCEIPKLRVVFDASSKTSSGYSLNDLLFSGSKLQSLITDIITLFRKFPYVFSCDIVQMYRQILIHSEDQPYQCVLWRESPHHPIKVYHLTTVTYGVTSAPYLALRTLLQLAKDEGSHHPEAAFALQRNTFVDDIVTGGETIAAALLLRDDLMALLARGGFTLKKWRSNHPLLLSNLPLDYLEASSPDNRLPLLGLVWNSDQDTFSFEFSVKVPSIDAILTKRMILAQIAALYDPVGWLSPVILKAKCFLQKLWSHPLDWDTPLPASLLQEWHSFVQALSCLKSISVPRPLPSSVVPFQLHGFCDASKAGYAAVLYLRSISDTPHITLLASKTRVAPLRPITIPRLELLGAHLLASLTHHYTSLFQGHLLIESIHLWCDSTIVLSWLKIPPNQLKMFVGNRVAQILDWTLPSMWQHVSSSDNPADVASRGLMPSQLADYALWWVGPPWLLLVPAAWPSSTPSHDDTETISTELVQPSLVTACAAPIDLFPYVSQWSKLIQYVFLILKWRCRANRLESHPVVSYDVVFSTICRYVQLQAFRSIFSALTHQNELPKSFQRLNLFVDSHNVIRVNGRLPSSSYQPPILLPKHHRIVHMLIDYYHITYGHAGPALIQSQLFRRVWILSGRQVIRSRVFSCHQCFRARPVNKAPLMADLPVARVTPSPPFYHTGMDYAGPFSAKVHHLHNPKQIKVYLCIFICFTTKAIHLELALDLSSQAFIDVLQRFIGRRSTPLHLYSDCGTNFVGAAAKLNQEWQQQLSSAAHELVHFTAMQGIQFHFNPPAAPHMGGLWERAVQSTKFHLTRMLGTRVLTTFQLSTLFIRIEAILNSRPLTQLSTDPTDLEALTPAHFLVGRPMIAPPEPNLLQEPHLVSKYHQVQLLSQQFWSRWRAEYLPSLQPRNKWTKHTSNLEVGDLVVLHEPNTPPLHWPLGRITEVIHSADNVVRRAKKPAVRQLSVTSWRRDNDEDNEQEEVETQKQKPIDPAKDRTQVIPVETSIKYLQSKAFQETYGGEPVWKYYRRNFKGQFPPRLTRKRCIRLGFIKTGSPCPICRDEYLVLDYRNIELLKHFISPHTGETLSYKVTGICQYRYKELLLALAKARNYGLLPYDVPFRKYDYSLYYDMKTSL